MHDRCVVTAELICVLRLRSVYSIYPNQISLRRNGISVTSATMMAGQNFNVKEVSKAFAVLPNKFLDFYDCVLGEATVIDCTFPTFYLDLSAYLTSTVFFNSFFTL